MNFNWDVFWQYLLQPSGVYLTGLWLTCLISVLAMALGCVLGLAAAGVVVGCVRGRRRCTWLPGTACFSRTACCTVRSPYRPALWAAGQQHA